MVKRESSEKGFPYLLGAQLLSGAVGVEHFHSVSERGPEILKSVIKDVFKCVTIMVIHFHPCVFFHIIDGKFGRGDKTWIEGATREKPTKLNAKEQKEAVDVTRKVVRLSVRRMGMWMW